MTDAEVVAACTDTILDYAEFVDGAEAEKWADLFCTDGVFDEGRVCEGRDAIETQFRRLMKLFNATAHHITNIRVRRTGDETAAATSLVYAWHEQKNGDQMEIWGRYVDELRVEDGRWRFAHRKVEKFGSRGMEIALPQVPRRHLD